MGQDTKSNLDFFRKNSHSLLTKKKINGCDEGNCEEFTFGQITFCDFKPGYWIDFNLFASELFKIGQ